MAQNGFLPGSFLLHHAVSRTITRFTLPCRGIAQLVERRSPKPKVHSSSLCAPAIFLLTFSKTPLDLRMMHGYLRNCAGLHELRVRYHQKGI